MNCVIIAEEYFDGTDSKVLFLFENVPMMLLRPKSKQPGIPPVEEQRFKR